MRVVMKTIDDNFKYKMKLSNQIPDEILNDVPM